MTIMWRVARVRGHNNGMQTNVVRVALALIVIASACSGAPSGDMTGAGGDDESTAGRGAGGTAPAANGGRTGAGGSVGSGGVSAPSGGTGGELGGSPGTGGEASVDAGEGGSGEPPADAAAEGGSSGSTNDGGPLGPPAAGQGPVAEGKIAFSQDFEKNMDGMTRSPSSLPEDRIQIIDDPTGQRGKIVRIMFKDGDNFRTSGGTQPRSWFSAAMGYTVKPGTTVSVAWGFMWENVAMNAHFAQLIRNGGPTWMWDVDGAGYVSMTHHRGTGATGNIMKLEPMKWYDFMVTTHYAAGGETKFYVNGKLVLTGKSPGGPDGRFDFGIYTRAGAHPARNVFISNVSIGEP